MGSIGHNQTIVAVNEARSSTFLDRAWSGISQKSV
jgi:hypothetical protein